ncbi:uncharacterized protein RJT20DRAFT_131092 [Scheffersomyces xylosifermentans]|uniref:uncharacterized protein n=1 Tax=Scheffersomyces xylosifermentans TaxID=1304137 RepID=UPI00315CA3C3
MSTKKRNRATKVCDFCKKRKVKCDLGNPCSTCVKYRHRVCRYSDLSVLGNDDDEVTSSSDMLVQDQLMQLKKKLKNLEESVKNRPETRKTGSASSLNSMGSNYSGSNSNSNSIIFNEPNSDYSYHNNTIGNIGNTNINQNSSKNSKNNSSTNINTINGSSTGTFSSNGTYPNNNINNNDIPVQSIFLNSKDHNVFQTPTASSNKSQGGYSPNNHTINNNINSTGSSSAYSPKNPNQRFTDLSSVLGHNPVASPDDTINFYEGYTSVYDKEPIRRRNFGPLSWISLIKIDNSMGKLWDYLHAVKNSAKGSLHKDFCVEETQKGGVEVPPAAPTQEEIRERLDTSKQSKVIEKVLKGIGPTDEDYAENVLDGATTADRDFRHKVTNDEGYDDIRPYKDSSYRSYSAQKTTLNQRSHFQDPHLSEKAKSLGLMFYQGGLDEELALVEKIRLVLPKRKAIWLLYKRFFNYLYPAIPLLDEVVFKEQIQKLIGLEVYKDEDVVVHVEKRMDFALLGLLLIVLRLSYLTLFTNVAAINEENFVTDDPSPRAQESKYLLNNPINIDVIDVAQTCLNQFNLMRSVNMTIMQLAVFTRLYHMYAPEDGDGTDGGDAQVFNAMLIQMAYSLGLHREPDNFPNECNDEKINNLGRKIWFMLLVLDVNNSMANGTPQNANILSFDTKFPFYRPGNENVVNVELEKSTLSNFSRFDHIYSPMTEILGMVVQVKGRVKMVDLVEKLGYMESHFIEVYGKMGNHFDAGDLTQIEIYQKTLKMKIHFTSNLFIVSIFFHIFNFYEKKGNSELAFYYLKKIFLITILDLMPFYFEFLNRSHLIFKNSTDLTITPGFESVTHKSLIVVLGIFIRVKFAIKKLETGYDHSSRLVKDIKYKIHYECLLRIANLLEKCTGVFRESIARLSHRYYYAWRITKAQNFLTALLSKDQFYDQYAFTMSEPGLVFTNDMLEELTVILETALFRVKEQKKSKKENEEGNTQEKNSHTRAKTNPRSERTTNEKKNFRTSVAESAPMDIDLDKTASAEESGRFTPGFGSTASVGSTTSNDFDVNDYMPNNEIDSIWLQMMSMKSATDPSANFNSPFPSNIGSEQFGNSASSGIFANDMGPVSETIDLSSTLSGFGGYSSGKELFENIRLEDIFKDIT